LAQGFQAKQRLCRRSRCTDTPRLRTPWAGQQAAGVQGVPRATVCWFAGAHGGCRGAPQVRGEETRPEANRGLPLCVGGTCSETYRGKGLAVLQPCKERCQVRFLLCRSSSRSWRKQCCHRGCATQFRGCLGDRGGRNILEDVEDVLRLPRTELIKKMGLLRVLQAVCRSGAMQAPCARWLSLMAPRMEGPASRLSLPWSSRRLSGPTCRGTAGHVKGSGARRAQTGWLSYANSPMRWAWCG
jgi:hypothetical protein